MHPLEFFLINRLEGKSFKQVKLVEAKQDKEIQNNTKAQDGDAGWIIILVPVSFMLVCAAIGSVILALSKVIPDKDRQPNINHRQQIPCSNCQFFSNNHYLKCAVHPSTVLTEQALNCADYWTL